MRIKTPPLAPYSPLFDDAWLKWGWAVKHAQTLQAEALRALDTHAPNGVTTRAEYDPKMHGFSIRIEGLPTLPSTLGLHLGDVLHSFRSALDNAAWAVVQRGTRPPATLTEKEKKRVAFPCIETRPLPTTKRTARAVLDAWFEDRVPGAGRADLAVIRWAQPYQWPQTSRAWSTFPLLVEKNNLDKHKTIQPVLLASYKLIPERIAAHHCLFRRITLSATGPLKVGAEIARVYVRKTGPDPRVEMQGQFGATVHLDNRTAAEVFLTVTDQWTYEVLSRFSAQPPDLADRLEPSL